MTDEELFARFTTITEVLTSWHEFNRGVVERMRVLEAENANLRTRVLDLENGQITNPPYGNPSGTYATSNNPMAQLQNSRTVSEPELYRGYMGQPARPASWPESPMPAPSTMRPADPIGRLGRTEQEQARIDASLPEQIRADRAVLNQLYGRIAARNDPDPSPVTPWTAEQYINRIGRLAGHVQNQLAIKHADSVTPLPDQSQRKIEPNL